MKINNQVDWYGTCSALLAVGATFRLHTVGHVTGESMIGAAAIALIVAIALMLIRALRGPTLYDRVLAVNSLGTKIVLFIGILGFVLGRPDFLDIAVLYALINFVSTIAILKFFRYRSFQVPLMRRTVARQTQPEGDDV